MNAPPDHSDLLTRLHYDPDTGIFTRKVAVAGNPVGSVCGTVLSNGYTNARFRQKVYKAHRLAWFYVHGVWPPKFIDHINGVRSDNRLCNLRLATKVENARNCKVYASSTTGLKGVHFSKALNRYVARIMVDKHRIVLGCFHDKGNAARAYEAAAAEYFGNFRRKIWAGI